MDREIDDFIKRKRYRQVNSVLVYRDGEILAESYYNGFTKESRNVIKSVAKSVMSICAGIALDKGLLASLDEPICRYISQFDEGRDPLHSAITVRHLLTMTSGIYWNGGVHYHCPMMTQMRKSGDWISHIADCVVSDMPGTKYCYKEWDVILLAKVLDAVCGDFYDFLKENLYDPLEISSERWYRTPCGVYYSVAEGDEESEERRSSLTAQEMLRLGKLFLDGGVCNGKRVVSEAYIRQAVAASECNEGYGYLWWRSDDRYGCRGFGGQSITVVPEKRAVVVTQATPTARGMAYFDLVEYCLQLCLI
ncbi:MAG: serine hydrolase [Lachnospiraceae bacterium]|nr:serine hydrolase [Lachnospiraceae bacterium]